MRRINWVAETGLVCRAGISSNSIPALLYFLIEQGDPTKMLVLDKAGAMMILQLRK
jgi:hypothetical protein